MGTQLCLNPIKVKSLNLEMLNQAKKNIAVVQPSSCQYIFEANRSRGSLVIIGHTNILTDRQTRKVFIYIDLGHYYEIGLKRVDAEGEKIVMAPSPLSEMLWPLHLYLKCCGPFTFI